MAKIQSLLEGRDERIDYDKLIEKYPWILEEGVKCVISPDSDGLLCGLFMSHYLKWEIVGFYDAKVLLLKDKVSPQDCVFLDVEIFRDNIRSIGHHMLLYNKNIIPPNWGKFSNCIQPNNMRNYDAYHNFRLKYPLATIHLLIGIVGSKLEIEIPETAICPLFFTDGTYNVLFKYPENVLNWLKFLKAGEEKSILKDVFENKKYSVYSLMLAMDDFFRERDEISVVNERGDRLRISSSKGEPYNITKQNNLFEIENNAIERIVRFIKILSKHTGWYYKEDNWTWSGFKLYRFSKKDLKKKGLTVCGRNYDSLLLKNPLSWAITSRDNIEYTLEEPDTL